MKNLVEFEQPIGGDGASASGALGVENMKLKAKIEIAYPLEKVVEPVLKIVDGLVDNLEKFIPGDQLAMAASAKADARASILKALSDQTAETVVQV